MHTNTPTEDSSGDRAGYTEHREPLSQGAYRYVRCEGCGREILEMLGGREKLTHRDGCPVGRRERR